MTLVWISDIVGAICSRNLDWIERMFWRIKSVVLAVCWVQVSDRIVGRVWVIA